MQVIFELLKVISLYAYQDITKKIQNVNQLSQLLITWRSTADRK